MPWGGGNPVKSRLGRRLLGWFLLFSLVPLLGSNMVGYLESQGIIERLIERHLAAIADVEAQHIRDQVDRLLMDLQAISAGNEFLAAGALRESGGPAHPMTGVADREAVEAHLSRKRHELPAFELLFLQRPDGSVVASTGSVPPGSVLGPDEETGGPRFETLQRGSSDSAGNARPWFRLSVAVRTGHGHLAGYLVGLMRPAGLVRLLEIPEHLAGSIESFIVDERGRPLFVSHPHGEVDYGTALASPLLARHTGSFARYPDREGVEVIGTAVSIEGVPWRYVAEFPVSHALGPLRNLRRLSVIFGGAFAIVLIVTALLVAGGIVAPIGRLVRATRRVAAGDLEVQVEVEETDEIGELERAFNEMTGELARTSARVEELHQREIERAQQLATVGELASGVAHEIKNPVVGISNGLDLVRRRIGRDETLEPIMDEMSHQLARIELAVRDLLAFARPATPSLAPVDGNQVVERALRLAQPAAERAKVALDFRPHPSLPEIQADEELLHQALVNLVMNAIQATPPRGSVAVSTHVLNGHVHFEVADTGKGIVPDDLDDIFKPFFTTRHSGSGLGLPITREIVERHGGRVEVESRVGRGSTFTVVMPIVPGAEEGATEPLSVEAVS